MATIASRDPIAPRHPLPIGLEEALAALDTVRGQTLALVGHLDDDELSRVLSPIMSPLAWDLAHIAAYEDLWLAHRYGGLELARPDLAELYDAFETPRSVRGEVELLSPEQARAYLRDVRARTAEALSQRGVGDGTIYELVLRHELQHSETMRQTMALAGLLPAGEPPLGAPREARGSLRGQTSHDRPAAGVWVEVAAGPFEMGAASEGFAYDNERPRHMVELPAFQIARRPVSNASWMRFCEEGGYQRREWWSEEGWRWREEYDITHDRRVADGHPDAPVCHVSWFEADAFARAAGARLPSEAEWEKAATLASEGQSAGREVGKYVHDAGSHTAPMNADSGVGKADVDIDVAKADVDAGVARNHANTGVPVDVGARIAEGGADNGAARASAGAGVLEGVGYVWEWTSSRFEGYPGFVAHPYREYSEVFFGGDYRTLRGGSWATSPRVGTVTFRNWDHPIRRQIFAGVRLAREAS
jgi:iron(II)-dependent oxidoreductase